VPNIWVVNASPVITLAKAGHLALLTELADEVLLPDAVVSELLAAAASDPARQAIERGWGNHISIVDVPAVVLEWGLGAGEAAVLAAVLQSRERTAVLDDAQGRKCARALAIPVIGTLGVVLRAKKMGCVASATSILHDLQDAGLYLDPATIAAALKQSVEEEWR
jgi:predicted nucleic acid-binding protein